MGKFLNDTHMFEILCAKMCNMFLASEIKPTMTVCFLNVCWRPQFQFVSKITYVFCYLYMFL